VSKKSKPPVDPLAVSVKALEGNTAAIHIKSLRFPNYRNLQLGARLPFDFPLTVLLGRNGTNKSSILHALYGSAHGKTVADFWFETEIDTIPPTVDGIKQSVAHSYLDDKENTVESIKARAPRRAADPDYWESVKPTQVYGFEPGAERVSPISLQVTHLDFRGELPAFDKYFYFPDSKHLARRASYARRRGTLRREYRKQDYLRRRSFALKKELEASGVHLTGEELDILRYILERDYVSGSVLRHDLFHGHEGSTIVFKTHHHRGGYSDAFAGSGESAAALLVHNVLEAPRRSLVLLDEPETSLHPRAQQRILEFLAHQAVRKSLQIVMATHSIYLAKDLPQSAIRVLESGADGRISVSTSHSAAEALHEIGTLPSGKTILVEDERAKAIVLASLKKASHKASEEFRVVVRDGGTSRIFRDIQAHANSGRTDVFVVFDGDHRPAREMPSDGELPQGEAELREVIRCMTSGRNRAGPGFDFVNEAEMTKYIAFLRDSVHYLPSTTPESLVWSDQRAQEILGTGLPVVVTSESDVKRRLELLAELALGHTADSVFHFLLASFLASESEDVAALTKMIDSIRNRS